MNTATLGELSPEHIPLRHEAPFPYALVVLSRQGSGGIYVWTGGSSRADLEQSFKWTPVTKVLMPTAFWVQSLSQLDGQTPPLDTSVPFPTPLGVTLQDLLAHCSGLPSDNLYPDGVQDSKNQLGVRLRITSPQAATIAPFTKRIYSNCGFEAAVSFAATKLAIPWTQWVTRTILRPPGVSDTKPVSSLAWGATSPINDLAKLVAEPLNSTRTPLSSSDIAGFARPVRSGLRGMLSGCGHYRDNPQGIGIGIRGHKTPYYLPPEFPSEVLGHFGQSGSFIWIDLGVGVAGVFSGDQSFGSIHRSLWPQSNTRMRHLALSAQG